MRLFMSRLPAGDETSETTTAPGRRRHVMLVLALAVALSGCANRHAAVAPSEGHIAPTPKPAGEVPAPVKTTSFAVPPPKPAVKPPSYSVVVNDVPVKELLQALARDTKENIDIHPGLTGTVSINAINETLPAILDRAAKQVNMRYRREGNTIIVQPDAPYLKTYRINYVNMERDAASQIGVSGSISGTSTGGSGSGGGQTGGGQGANQSQTTVNTRSQNHFWTLLQDNVRAILASTQALSRSAEERAARNEALRAAREERIAQAEAVARAGAAAPQLLEKAFPTGSTQQRDIPGDINQNIVVNPVAGTLSVLATEHQHELIQQHIDSVLNAVQRQVLIEATIVEVTLSDAYQAGVDWSRLPISGGLSFTQSLLSGFGDGLTQAGNNQFRIGYVNTDSKVGNISATIRLLEEFGKTQVLSSPKLMAMNNQTALLKVVDNVVYFEVSSSTVTSQVQTNINVSTTAKTVSIGVVMGVTPQITEDGRITLTVRPSVTRLLGFVRDPNPALAIPNLVPEIQTREMESVLQVGTGQTAILGGLMEDDIRRSREQLPGADTLGGAGELFRFRDNRNTKRELVIFLKPTIVSNPSLDSDELKFYQRFLPRAEGKVGAAP
jgi:general secretion pathway protein D